MNMAKLYDLMKEALRALDLSWSQIDQVTIRIVAGDIMFSGNNRTFVVKQKEVM